MRPTNRTIFRRSGGALLVALAAVTLSGCVGMLGGGNTSAPAEERTRTEVVAELKEVPGVVEVVVTSGPTGLPSQIALVVGVNLEAGYPGNLPALLDYTLAMAWSVTAEQPTTIVSVGFLAGDTAVDLEPVVAEWGWTGFPGPKLDLPVDNMVERYGSWPGKAPDRPAELN